MARYKDSVCRLCRRENMKLFLKGERCLTNKCAVDKRSYPPGQHGQRRQKFSTYGIQLREKQKVKRIYGVLEKQFRSYFDKADRKKGITGENLLQLLERRLDNVIYRLGLTTSRKLARQLVRHNHFNLNKRKVNIPSLLVTKGDVVELKLKSIDIMPIHESLKKMETSHIPEWLSFDQDSLKATVLDEPKRENITVPIQEQLIVELYSK
ncbi:MAG: 30S ribosomal protein S4 [Nitrospinota bacterium]|nr:30S ribosomal protein S4 [Nitrospinota bacterium]